MLGKVIKHEWKSIYKIGSVLLLALAVVTILVCIAFCVPKWVNLDFSSSPPETGFLVTSLVLVMVFVYVIALAGLSFAILIYIAIHFYRSMYTEQGYMTHTLPVNSHQLLFGKILVGSIWYIFIILAMILSVMFTIFCVTAIFYTGDSMWQDIVSTLRSPIEYFDIRLGTVLPTWILQFIISTFTTMVNIFGAITIGQLSARFKVMMSILSYLGIGVVQWIINYIFTFARLVWFINIEADYDLSFWEGSGFINPSTIINLLIAVGLYFLSNYIIVKKLNLE